MSPNSHTTQGNTNSPFGLSSETPAINKTTQILVKGTRVKLSQASLDLARPNSSNHPSTWRGTITGISNARSHSSTMYRVQWDHRTSSTLYSARQLQDVEERC